MMTDINLEAKSATELLALYVDILSTLRAKKVIRSSNPPLGDYAESLFCEAFGWELESNSKAGYDAVDKDNGTKYQIKGRRPTKGNSSRQLSAIRKLNEKQFDFLAAVLFHEDFSVYKAILIPHSLIKSKLNTHVNASIFHLRDSVWDLEGAKDITNEIKAAALIVGNVSHI